MSEALKQKILSSVEKDLIAIEAALADNLNPYFDLVSDIAQHILFSGGKRLRPLLTVLSARLCGYNGDGLIRFSTIFEFLHAATLLHDDLVDDATMRRGKPAAHSVWDNSTAVLVGDFLLARSLSLASETGRPKVIKVIAGITENMSQGEIQQLHRKGDIDLSEAEYMETIFRKTAVLFEGACRVSAILADMTEKLEGALSDYGRHLGLAFQMADDLLDYTVDSQALGKVVGADLREGKLTLPVIHALARGNAVDRDLVVQTIQEQNLLPDEFEKVIDLLHKYGGIEYTRKKATEHIQLAKEAISIFDPSQAKDVLLDIADYALVRRL